MKKLLEIIQILSEDGLPNRITKGYRLEIKQVHANRTGLVQVKLLYKGKVKLAFAEGFRNGKSINCTKKQHKLLVDIGMNIYLYEDELK